jgi:tetratricopeptide (TPR) repeat protein
MNNLGNLLQELGRYAEAEPLLQRALAVRRRAYPEGHPSTSVAMVNLAGMYLRQQSAGAAEPVLREAIDLLRRHQGDDHHLTLSAANSLGVALQMQGKLGDAEGWTRMAMEGRRRTLGESHKDTLSATNAYAVLLTRQGRAADAEPLQRRVLERARATLRPDDYLLGIYGSGLARTLAALERRTEAEKVFLEAHEAFERGVGTSFPYAQRNLEALARLHEDWEKAEPGMGHATRAARWLREIEAVKQAAGSSP